MQKIKIKLGEQSSGVRPGDSTNPINIVTEKVFTLQKDFEKLAEEELVLNNALS